MLSIRKHASHGTGISIGGQDADPKTGWPKYQYGDGCLSDQMIGQWMARVVGLGDLLDPEKVKATGAAIFRYNWRPALWEHANPQRIYARDEQGIGELLWPPEISATGDTYRKFLQQFLPQFEQFLDEEGVREKSLFHCADEPDGDVGRHVDTGEDRLDIAAAAADIADDAGCRGREHAGGMVLGRSAGMEVRPVR